MFAFAHLLMIGEDGPFFELLLKKVDVIISNVTTLMINYELKSDPLNTLG